MNKVEHILDQLDRTRERLLVAVEPLSDEALLEPGAVGRFSVADLLVHLTAWETELVTGLLRLNQGGKPGSLLAALARPDAHTQQWYEAHQGRDLDRIFDDLRRVRVQLEGWLEEFSDRDLTDPQRYRWFRGKSLAQVIEETTFGKETAYLPALEAFAQRWVEAYNSAGDDLIVPISAVLVEDERDDDDRPDSNGRA